MHWGSGLCHTLSFLHAIPNPFLTSFGLQHCPSAEPGLQWASLGYGQLFFCSQEEFCMSDICWSRTCAGAQLWRPSNLSRDRPPWPPQPGDAEEKTFCTGLSATTLVSLQHRQFYPFSGYTYAEFHPSGQTELPACLWIHKTIFSGMGFWWSFWGLHENIGLCCPRTIPGHHKLPQGQGDMLFPCSHPIMLPPSSEHPSGKRSTFIAVGMRPAQHIWVLVTVELLNNAELLWW